jgi:hypothetical protein
MSPVKWRQYDEKESDVFHDRAGRAAHGAGFPAGNRAGQSISFFVSSTGSGMGGNLGGYIQDRCLNRTFVILDGRWNRDGR